MDHSYIHILVAAYVVNYCLVNNLPTYSGGADGAYNINGNVVVPDYSYRAHRPGSIYPDPVPPLFVVEVIFPTNTPKEIREKRNIYIQAGILYWEIYQDTQSIDVYEPGKPPRALGINDTLDGANVLPGFTLPVKNLFPD